MLRTPDSQAVFEVAFREHEEVVRQLEKQRAVLESIAAAMSSVVNRKGKILWCGNGGSAADSQHLAAEFVGRFRRERRALASIALTTDSSILTAVANDYGFETVFSRQVEALGNPGDLIVGISTSGNSLNIIAALEAARTQGLRTVGFTGEVGGRIAHCADHLLAIASRNTARIQEAHIFAGHILCDWIDMACLCPEDGEKNHVLSAEKTR